MRPLLMGIFTKLDVDGDDALLRLAQARYEEAGLGAEVYPESPGELVHLLGFLPPGPAVAHLPRWLDVTRAEHRNHILEYAWAAGGRLHGFNVHEHAAYGGREGEVAEGFRALDRMLATAPGSPHAFIEYSGALSPDDFARLFEASKDARRVSACIDIGHVGIRAAAEVFTASTGLNVFDLRPDSPELPALCDRLGRAVEAARPVTRDLIRRLSRLGKPVHYHLHDGHPLSRISRFNVSDHLSFLEHTAIPFAYRGRRLLAGMYGPAGLAAVAAEALRGLPNAQVSFSLEIHRREGRRPLGRHAPLFGHWKDTANAERMAFWLDVVLDNAQLLDQACAGTGERQ